MKNVSAGLDTRKYLHVGSETFQVEGDKLILLDDWGVRTWKIENIEARLDALIAEVPTKPDAGDA